MSGKNLRFLNLSERHIGVTAAIAANFAEAACVCLDRHHTPPTQFHLIDNASTDTAAAVWTSTDQRARNAWANRDDATRDGAYGLALAAIEEMRGLVAVHRAETRTGSDWYVGPPTDAIEDLEKAFRLEISGTDEGNQSVISGRLRQKIEQARKGNSNLPAIAAVVGFAAGQISSANVESA
jgi:hypothetical protein